MEDGVEKVWSTVMFYLSRITDFQIFISITNKDEVKDKKLMDINYVELAKNIWEKKETR